jgi:hypothetical protein
MGMRASSDSVFQGGFAVAPLLSEHARHAEELRTMPPHVVEARAAAGVPPSADPRP